MTMMTRSSQKDAVTLAYRFYSGSGIPVVILHGLFGSKTNWHRIARQLSPDLAVYAVDQRNHGQSPHRMEAGYMEMAEDLAHFQSRILKTPFLVLGHSMGGKTAMQYALAHGRHVSGLIVVDMGPGQGIARHDTILEGLQLLQANTIHSRSQAEALLLTKVADPATCRFLLQNLTREPDGRYRLSLNLEAIQRCYEKLLAPVEGPPYDGPVLFIRGGQSDYLPATPTRRMRRLFPAAAITTIAGAGHWVHWDQPDKLIGRVRQFAAGREL
jgi:esterase